MFKGFEIKKNGLVKSLKVESQIVNENGLEFVSYVLKATSMFETNNGVVGVEATVELVEGVVIYSSFKPVFTTSAITNLISLPLVTDDIEYVLRELNYLDSSWAGNKTVDFAESILGLTLSINSFNRETFEFNNKSQDLLMAA